MQEYVLHGWSEEKCAKHRQNAIEGNFQTRCDRDGTCIYTGAPHVKLNYSEYELLQDIIDYINTNQILDTDKERRRTIIRLGGKLREMQAAKAKVDYGGDRRTKN